VVERLREHIEKIFDLNPLLALKSGKDKFWSSLYVFIRREISYEWEQARYSEIERMQRVKDIVNRACCKDCKHYTKIGTCTNVKTMKAVGLVMKGNENGFAVAKTFSCKYIKPKYDTERGTYNTAFFRKLQSKVVKG